ncbi:Ger(x)C family spore germination protein [Alkalithermobacter paradoxus]|uniref:Spore germination protein B3 n=1 Tax=Alkalithermobacter paradoxus TaxID=29349 RepID=A0A1V4I5Z1_9FIRM|nr:spore germination protein B3 precursor [[Clostridium] thermoalcaliphilum]
MIKKILLIIIIILVSINLTGCWSNNSLRERSIVIGVGLDKGYDGEIELTLQIAKPGLLKANQPTVQNAVKVVSFKGNTVFEAARNALKMIDKKPYYGHYQIIVIGEELAKEGIEDYLDFFARDHEPGLKPYVLVSKGITARKVLESKSAFENIPAIYIKGIMENYENVAKIKTMTLGDVIKELNYPENSPSIGLIESNTGKVEYIEDMEIGGAAVFKEDKLTGYLNEQETKGLLFVKDKIKSMIIEIENPIDKSEKVALEVLRSKTNIDVESNGYRHIFFIDIKTDVNLAEQHGRGDLTTRENSEILEKEAEKAIENYIRSMMYKVQKEYQSDVVGFYKALRRKYPKLAEEHRLQWEEEFSNVPVKIRVNVNIRRTGLIGKTIESL